MSPFRCMAARRWMRIELGSPPGRSKPHRAIWQKSPGGCGLMAALVTGHTALTCSRPPDPTHAASILDREKGVAAFGHEGPDPRGDRHRSAAPAAGHRTFRAALGAGSGPAAGRTEVAASAAPIRRKSGTPEAVGMRRAPCRKPPCPRTAKARNSTQQWTNC